MQIEVLRTAQSLGVSHVVKLSALGASDHSKSGIGRQHHAVEEALEETSVQRTTQRPHAFMQNWLGDVAQSVRSRAVIESPSETDAFRSSTRATSPRSPQKS